MATAAAAPKRWAREYETIYILRPDVDHDAAEKIVERAQDVIKRLEGTLTKLDNWGKRKLAYPIQKNTRGIFVYLKYVGFSDLVAELERNLRLIDEVVRFQTVLLDEDVDPAAVSVDPEEVKYLEIEEDEDDAEDAELERARSLGMAPRPPREPVGDEAPAAAEAPSADAAEGAGADATATEGQDTAATEAESSEADAPAADAPATTETEASAAADSSAETEADKKEEG